MRRAASVMPCARCGPPVAGSLRTPKRLARGRSSFNSSIFLMSSSVARMLMPVMLRAGLVKSATRPESARSSATHTMGTVVVAAWAARPAGSPNARITVAPSRTRPSASAGRRSSFPSASLISIRTVRPSMSPCLASDFLNCASPGFPTLECRYDSVVDGVNQPTTAIFPEDSWATARAMPALSHIIEATATERKLDNLPRLEVRHARSWEPEDFSQHLLGMLPSEWRRRGHRLRGRKADRAGGDAEATARGMVDGDDGVARVQMRVVQHLARVQHGAARHAGLGQRGHDFLLRPRAGPCARDGVQLVHVLPARGGVHAARIGQQILAPDGACKIAPHVLVHRLHVDIDVVVGPARRARIEAVGDGAGRRVVAPPRGGFAVAVMRDVALADEIRHGFLHRHLDHLALAGALPLDVGSHDPRRHVHAGAAVADVGAAEHGLAISEARDAHHAARGLGDHVEALVLVIRPRKAKALEPRHDDPWIGGAERIPAEAQPLHEARGEVLDDHVRLLRHLQKQRAAVGLLEIDGHAPLVGVEEEEEHRVETGYLWPVATRLLAPDGLDLDDVGAEPAQELGAGGAGLELRQVQDADARQRALAHDGSLLAICVVEKRAESYHAPRILVDL